MVVEDRTFFNKLVSTAESFLDSKEFDAAKDIYSEISIQYPQEYEGYYGYIRSVTHDFTKYDISRRLFNAIRKDKAIIDDLLKDEKLKDEYNTLVDNYLDAAYDDLQTRLEVINADANKLQAKQIAHEQLTKSKYNKEKSRLKRKKVIQIIFSIVFAVLGIAAMTMMTYIVVTKLQSSISFYEIVQDLQTIVYALLFVIFLILFLVSIKAISTTNETVKKKEKEYENEINKYSLAYSQEYKRSQKEYEELTKEE